ncbi:MAG TPA: tRNA (cytidine(34)-2'-O)-methyltransferase [Candidatus Mailhella excrementigallinarum]|nr:MAG: tRNA (uridine(34)/cytosine(34)/5-carboxymethylaminomethyluridine(34)-2'-O)-methyltransferase TrmL [Desulfovibrionaceae bacterium]HIV66712.1 tRNA (cytidine(34)-2'-O)-methyltransferase [Candidatus Mailhella excrementigallinarum]
MHIVLFEPEIPPNTGNIARLCAGTDTPLHLVEPLGFSLEDRYLRRAGLDYWPHVRIRVWRRLEDYLAESGPEGGAGRRLVMTSARTAEASVPVHRFPFAAEDALVFGPETRGLPPEVLQLSSHRVRIPINDNIRSLNLSTSAGIVLMAALARTGGLEAW